MAKKTAAHAKKAPARKAGTKKVKAIPKGYRSITPYLSVSGAREAVRFYKKVFGAKEVMRIPMPGGLIGHSELVIGDSKVMLADEFPEMGFRGPHAVGGTPVIIHLYVKHVDKVFARALKAGAKERQPLKDQFYGDRSGTLEDPFGHLWNLSTHVEHVSPKEMARRAREAAKAGAA